MFNPIDDYVKRPDRIRNIDGSQEMACGILVVASWVLVQLQLAIAPPNSPRFWPALAGTSACTMAVIFVVVRGLKALRKRITFPRTGYVNYRRGGTTAFANGIILGSIAAVLGSGAILAARHQALFHLRGEEAGLLVFGPIVYASLTRLDAAWRWAVLVALIAAPLAIAEIPLGHFWLRTLPVAAQGIIISLSGAAALALYLQKNRLPEEPAQ